MGTYLLKKHHTFSTSAELPILFVESYSDINLELLNNFSENIDKEKINKNKLNIDTWIGEMKKRKLLKKSYLFK